MTQAALALTAVLAFGPCKPPAGAIIEIKTVPVTGYFIPFEGDYELREQFLAAVKVEGSGQQRDGTYIARRAGTFVTVREPRGRYGELEAFATAAAHPELFEPGSSVCLPGFGITLTITDTGGGLTGEGPLDIFVGTRTAYNDWITTVPNSVQVIAWTKEN